MRKCAHWATPPTSIKKIPPIKICATLAAVGYVDDRSKVRASDKNRNLSLRRKRPVR